MSTVPSTTSSEAEREALARWLFERDYRERSLASPADAEWDDWVERNQEQWRKEAGDLLDFLSKTRAGAEKVAARSSSDAEALIKILRLALAWRQSWPSHAGALLDALPKDLSKTRAGAEKVAARSSSDAEALIKILRLALAWRQSWPSHAGALLDALPKDLS